MKKLLVIHNKYKIFGGEDSNIDDEIEHLNKDYEIKYLESNDGIQWGDDPVTCINILDDDEHGFGRPYIVRHENFYRMFYSIRRKSFGEYRLGFSDLDDDIGWIRKDDDIGLDVSKNGWDSKAIMYLSVISCHGKTYGFYNGNHFGETGIGYAELLEW